MSGDTGKTFKTKLEIHKWLRENGYRIGRSRFYDHCRDGLLRPDPKTGLYTVRTVRRYAKLHVRLAATGEKERTTTDRLQERKLRMELEREELRIRRERHDLAVREGAYVSRAEVEQELVARAVALMAGLKHTVIMRAADWCEMSGGDPGRAGLLVETVMADLDQWFGNYASTAEFDVILEKDLGKDGD